jgi:GTP-binding protein
MEAKVMKTRSAVVSIIGRPNVGKSTIFNRLMKKSFKAMTFNQPGVTRDRHYAIANFGVEGTDQSEDVILIDTGGFYPERIDPAQMRKQKSSTEPFFNLMADHAKLAIDESDLILFVVDVREGLLPFDKTICDYIRSTKKPMWLLINKFDSDKQWGEEADFYQLGIKEDDFFIVSAEHARGLGEVSDRIYEFSKKFRSQLKENKEVQEGVKPNHDVVANIAIIGAPNAGKSTLLNRLVGAQRALVSDVAGTTVDPIEAYFDLHFGDDISFLKSYDNAFRKSDKEVLEEMVDLEDEITQKEMIAYNDLEDMYKDTSEDIDDEESFEFSDEETELIQDTIDEDENTLVEINPNRSVKIVDTAGIRKRSQVDGFIEEQSVYRSLKAISESDIVIAMVDATKGITHQDRRLCDIALERGKSIIISLNKMDLLPEIMSDSRKKREWMLDLRARTPWLNFCEMITLSAKEGRYIKALKNSIKRTVLIRNKKVTTSKINKVISELVDRHPVVLNKSSGTTFKVKYASLIKSAPPTFLMFTNKSKGIPENYKKYLKNNLRREFNYINTPVHIIFRTTTDIQKRMRKLGVSKR